MAPTAPSSRPTVVFDGRCGFCSREVERLRRIVGERAEFRSFHDPGVLARFPALTAEACERALQFVSSDGAIREGAAGIAEALALSPRWRWAPRFYRLPLVRQAADRIYAAIALRRYRLGGSAGACPVPPGSSGDRLRSR